MHASFFWDNIRGLGIIFRENGFYFRAEHFYRIKTAQLVGPAARRPMARVWQQPGYPPLQIAIGIVFSPSAAAASYAPPSDEDHLCLFL